LVASGAERIFRVDTHERGHVFFANRNGSGSEIYLESLPYMSLVAFPKVLAVEFHSLGQVRENLIVRLRLLVLRCSVLERADGRWYIKCFHIRLIGTSRKFFSEVSLNL